MAGFLAATPHGSKSSRLKTWVSSLPPLGPLSYLWDWLCQLGIIRGGVELSFTDIKDWAILTGIKITPDEAILLAELSRIWLNENIRGRDPDAFPVWLPESE